MARIDGVIKVVGRLGNLCFYERNGTYCVRMKPGPHRGQFLKNKRYQPQREASLRMNKGNKVASLIYTAIDRDKRVYRICCELQRRAALLFKTDLSVEEITTELCAWVVEEGYLSPEGARSLPKEAGKINFSRCTPGSGRLREEDHLQGVRICTKEGRWIRIYHLDEWKLLMEYADGMKEGDGWVAEFLVRRKGLKTYRLRHRYKRKPERMSDVRSKDVRCSVTESELEVVRAPVVRRYELDARSYGGHGMRTHRRIRKRRIRKSEGDYSYWRIDRAKYTFIDST